jgi:TetR/AcrR family transcriptional regulator
VKSTPVKGLDEQSAKQLLFSAAITLFAEKGYASTSVREIVALAGVSKPVLYYYFESKEGLFRSILDWAAEEQQALSARVLETRGPTLHRVIHLFRRIYEGVMENPELYKLIHNLVFGPPQGAPEYDLEQYHQRMTDAVKTIYLEGLDEGELREADPNEVAIFVVGVADFYFHMLLVDPESFDTNRLERLIRMAFLGLTKPDLLTGSTMEK